MYHASYCSEIGIIKGSNYNYICNITKSLMFERISSSGFVKTPIFLQEKKKNNKLNITYALRDERPTAM